MRLILRAMLAAVLLLGGGVADWSPGQGHEACCCGEPTGVEDTCPCPKPEGNRTPLRGACADRQVVGATQVAQRRSGQGQRRHEPRPEPTTWAKSAGFRQLVSHIEAQPGRAPDLGQHLARLSTFRI